MIRADNKGNFKPYSTEENPSLKKVIFAINPNPTSGVLHIEIPQGVTLQAPIYNITGSNVLQQRTTNSTIDISSLTNGLYYIQFADAQTRSSTPAKGRVKQITNLRYLLFCKIHNFCTPASL